MNYLCFVHQFHQVDLFCEQSSYSLVLVNFIIPILVIANQLAVFLTRTATGTQCSYWGDLNFRAYCEGINIKGPQKVSSFSQSFLFRFCGYSVPLEKSIETSEKFKWEMLFLREKNNWSEPSFWSIRLCLLQLFSLSTYTLHILHIHY